ncbi:lytic transglycosylase domain-containing protein [Dyella humi]
MAAGFAMMGCQNLAVPAEVMQHVVHVESAANPFAIGVVGGQLVRQPRNLDEALATVQMLEAKGYNFSVGLAQVNRYNLDKYGLASYEQAFQACPNLMAASRILADCYASAGGDWGKSFSCYYAGDFVTGYRDGYVQKIYDSIRRTITVDGVRNDAVAPIPLTETTSASREAPVIRTTPAPDSPAYRVAIRSNMLDTAVAATITTATAAPAHANAPPQETPFNNETVSAIFVPQVRGPNDVPPTSTDAQQTTLPTSPVDQADLHQGGSDNAFVF